MPNSIVVSDLIKSSMRLVGAIATGETPSAPEINDGLLVLNDLLENWSTEHLSVWAQANQTFATVANQSVYTIGPTGNWNTVRPVAIQGAYCTYQAVDFPIEIIDQLQYNLIGLKWMEQPITQRLLYVADNPLGIITLWPVPPVATTVTLSIDRVLSQPVTANTVLTGPPGFTKALRFCLAVEFAAEFGINPPESVMSIAVDAKADYKRANMTPRVAQYDTAITSRGYVNWRYGY